MQNPSKEILIDWQKNPKNWKLGLFYYNKEDKRLFIDKRNPNLGITMNFAKRESYLFFLMSTIFFGFIMYMITSNQ
jgi:uncharacterized membrane protein